jgi:hypothetical protein
LNKETEINLTASLLGDPKAMQVFSKVDQKINDWIVRNVKDHRIFACKGKYAVASKNGKSPYDKMMRHFLIEIAGLLEKNPPFYFDIERHPSGIDVARLQSGKTYDCNILSEITDGGPAPDNGHYSDKKSSFVISLLAYKQCFSYCKQINDLQMAGEFAKRYKALLESQDQEQFIFYFGDAV